MMTPGQAISVLDQATQPGAKLSRADYVAVDMALVVLQRAISGQSAESPPSDQEVDAASVL